MESLQVTLSEDQIAAFYHDMFVTSQVHDFLALMGAQHFRVIDVGGGCGFFARALRDVAGCSVRVIDSDASSIAECRNVGLDAICIDALEYSPDETQDVASFNLILHHLVGGSGRETRELQIRALKKWRNHARVIFVNEYIYESVFGDMSGWLIFHITKNRMLSALCRWASAYVPAFRANTFGVGVRFRSHDEWHQVFQEAGLKVVASTLGEPESIPALWRLLMIRTIRRDSFRLEVL